MVALRHTLNFGASLVAQTVKNLPALLEVHVQSLGQEDTVEKRGATHCSILGWRIPWTEEPGRLHSSWWGYNPCGHKESDMTELRDTLKDPLYFRYTIYYIHPLWNSSLLFSW